MSESSVYRVHCPVVGCGWTYDEPALTEAPAGVDVAVRLRMQHTDHECAAHLSTHGTVEVVDSTDGSQRLFLDGREMQVLKWQPPSDRGLMQVNDR